MPATRAAAPRPDAAWQRQPTGAAMSRPWRRWLCVCALAAGATWPAQANVTCSLSTSALAFGNYDITNPVRHTSQSSLQVNCTNSGSSPATVSLSIAIGAGQNATHPNQRALRRQTGSGTWLLSYQLYQDSALSLPWGDTPGTNTQSVSLSVPANQSRSVTLGLYASAPAGQDLPAGVYADALLVTLTP